MSLRLIQQIKIIDRILRDLEKQLQDQIMKQSECMESLKLEYEKI